MLPPDAADAKPIKQSRISEDYSGAIGESTKNVLGVAVLDYRILKTRHILPEYEEPNACLSSQDDSPRWCGSL